MSLLLTSTARRDLEIGPELVDGRGRVTVPSFTVARRLALVLGKRSAPRRGIGAPIPAGDVVALSVLDDIFRALLAHYARRHGGGFLKRALGHLAAVLGNRETVAALGKFGTAFALRPSLASARLRDAARENRLGDTTGDARLMLEFVLFWLQRRNPAARTLVSEFHKGFEMPPLLDRMLDELEVFFGSCEGLGEGNLAADLLAALVAHPDSLAAQLIFLREAWGETLGTELWRVQSALDLIAEESTPRWSIDGRPPAEAPGLPVDSEKKYSLDREWMPRLVLAAKNTLVWMHQLSRAYGREISDLDEIPEEELALLAGRGVTGLWLIGLWERSPASSEIKRRRGNPEAASSAYSLRGYRIAEEFGGEEALESLSRRAARHGVRLAADMVPNHMGIDSDWLLDHPERFVRTAEPPFPAYSFNGADLSPRSDVGIFLEDHYYDNSDAAVVFKRLDRQSGEALYIFHGNDGTSTPWNDTAQLDYLDAGVREAVIQTILDVARRFPVIRFDAAMTLAKRHYHRLWHPRSGDSGAIPSRSEHSLSQTDFDALMPREFWREVVDRVSFECPDTLLLAEAFWLMEGYFVRTLGLHRVYNSAFMHMMRDGDTGKYRRMLKETLAFDPEILRRYVNFMSNPDEESAAEQFDVGDRYFGVCTVLVTLPGLPMLAHGQWDGLREKYGMEYRRSYRDELPQRNVIERHDREIAPLLARRAIFAGVERFRLYDFIDRSGSVLEDVLTYSNGRGDEAALVVFNNSPHPLKGHLWRSAPTRPSRPDEVPEAEAPEDETLRSSTLAEAMSMVGHGPVVNLLRDPVRGVTVVVTGENLEASGLGLELAPFETLVLSELELIEDTEGWWAALARDLGGRAVRDLEQSMMASRVPPLLSAVRRFVEALEVEDSEPLARKQGQFEAIAREVDAEATTFFSGPPFSSGGTRDRAPAAMVELARAVSRAQDLPDPLPATGLAGLLEASPVIRWAVALATILATVDERAEDAPDSEVLLEVFSSQAPLEEEAKEDLKAILRLVIAEGWMRPGPPPGVAEARAMVDQWSTTRTARQLLGVHSSGEIEWVVSERLDLLLAARRAFAIIAAFGGGQASVLVDSVMASVGWGLAVGAQARAAANYRLDEWRERMRGLEERINAPTTQGRD